MAQGNHDETTRDSQSLENVFIHNLNMGVPFPDCFMLILSLSGHTQASLMRCVNRTQSELSLYLNGHRELDRRMLSDLKAACTHELGFNPWDHSHLEHHHHG